MRFYLGTHMVSWMSRIHVPLFVSRRRLFKMKNLPRARGRWKQDSSGFTELSLHGRWTVPPKQYAAETVRFDRDIGNMDAAAVQDWMCEPKVLAQTGLTVLDHQRRTIDSFKALSDLAPDINWMPVVQGVARADYLRHLDMYDDAGIDLRTCQIVGIGSICRRENTDEAEGIIRDVAARGVRVHCFGLKIGGAARVADVIASSDSMAWSYWGRRSAPLPGCIGHKNCANCMRYALLWRDKVIESMGEYHEP